MNYNPKERVLALYQSSSQLSLVGAGDRIRWGLSRTGGVLGWQEAEGSDTEVLATADDALFVDDDDAGADWLAEPGPAHGNLTGSIG